MDIQKIKSLWAKDTTPQKLITGYDLLCQRYLPIQTDDIWRLNCETSDKSPLQGWKIHIAATIFSANTVLEKVAPFLETHKAVFKAPKSLTELDKLNSGLFYGYGQVGKFVTVYPKNDEEFVYLAKNLHRLTNGISAPSVPFDLRYCDGSNVYYRYGAFKNFDIKNPDGTLTPAIIDPRGKLVPDKRDNEKGMPEWINNPLETKEKKSVAKTANPLQSTYKIFKALSQRGKGGVYVAIDFSVPGARLCVIKEGRRDGEVNWLGRDGFDFVKNEANLLDKLKLAGLGLPKKYTTFELENNFYLAAEYVEGENLQILLAKRKRRINIKKALELSCQVARAIEKLHSMGWVWHDCKPGNIIVTKEGNLRLLDFEGACRVEEADGMVWGTKEFLPDDWDVNSSKYSPVSFDLYALGAVIYYLFCGRFYSKENPHPIEKLRPKIPAKLTKLIAVLLDQSPRNYPSAKQIVRSLQGELLKISAL